MRYFDFIKEIKEISTSHILVNEYGEGDIYEYLNNGEHKYPCIFLTVTNLTTTDSGTTINFTLFYTDRLVENQANKTSIQSTGISVIKQILSRYEQLHPEYLLSNVNYTPFTEKFTDMCAGVFCDVVIENQMDTLKDYDNECEEGAFKVKTITLTKNGVYDIVGYDTAVVLVEGEVKKLKVFSLRVDNNCIVDGTWNSESIDTSNVTNMNTMFYNCSSLQTLDVSNWNTSNVTTMYSMFQNCSSLQSVDVSNWVTSNVKDMSNMFSQCSSLQSVDVSNWVTRNVTTMYGIFDNCSSLQSIDLTGWNTSNVTTMSQMFRNCYKLTTLIGGITIDEVIYNNISALNGTKVYNSLINTILDRASLRAIINGLADLTGSTSQKLTLGSTLTAKLTEEDIAVATAKNWTIA